jgi:hypothetical protein
VQLHVELDVEGSPFRLHAAVQRVVHHVVRIPDPWLHAPGFRHWFLPGEAFALHSVI